MESREEFLRLFLRTQNDLRAFIGSLIRDADVREDVFQDVSLILWRQYKQYDSRRSFGAWARGIAANKIMQTWDQLARAARPFSPEAVQAILDAHDRTEREPLVEVDDLESCMQRLPDKSRQLLKWRYQDGLSLQEMGRKVGSSLHAVHMALSRIRQRLADCVRERLLAEEGSR